VDTRLLELRDLRLTLQYLQTYLTMGGVAAARRRIRARATAHQCARWDCGLRDAMHNGDPAVVARKLSLFQQALFNDLHDTLGAIASQDASAPLQPRTCRPPSATGSSEIRNEFPAPGQPKHDVWERKNQEEFVRELRSIDPDVTGEPVQLLEYTTLLKDSYIQAAWYALAPSRCWSWCISGTCPV